MAGTDRLIFPVQFDLESAIKRATGNADNLLRQLQTAINARPLAVDLKIKNTGTGSIDEINKRMQDLVEKWNSLAQSERIVSKITGEYTDGAKKIIAEYTRLVGATKSFAQGLEQIEAAAQRAANAEIRKNEKAQAELDKRIAKSKQLVAMLNAEETSITAVAAKLKFFHNIANQSDFGSKEFQYATSEVERLGTQIERLKKIMRSNTGNAGKDQFGLEQMRQTLRGSESTIDQVKAKLKVLNQLMSGQDQGSYGWRRMTEEALRLNGVLTEMKQRQKEVTMPDDVAYQKWLAQKDKEVQAQEQAEQRKTNATRQAIAKQNAEYRAEEEKRYQEYWNEKQREVQANEQAEAKKRAVQQQTAHEARSAAHKQAQEAYQTAQALRAQEDVLANLTKKLQIYNQQIQAQQVGSTAWNKSALEIRRLSDELERANQRLSDFQAKAFQGLNNDLTKQQVAQLTQWREQLRNIDAQLHEIQQLKVNNGGAWSSPMDEQLSNNLAKQRLQIQRQINETLKSGADIALEREKELAKIQDQRKAKAQAIADRKKAETQQTQANIAKLKEERRILNQQESSVKAITDKLSILQKRLQNTKLNSGEFEKIAKEVEQLTQKLDIAQRKIAQMTGQSKYSADQQAAAVRRVNNEFNRQETYISRLIKRLAIYAGFSQVMGFLRNVREVTAQFELQRISLGAIIQDQTRANQLFSEIKQFAIQSPLSIMDLTKYTKQVAAYGIETDKLFDTTKRLADVSVGLGVDMQRIVLAYGQVKAASYLRAAEVRQFTEAGIPMLELLAKKLTQMNGEMVTTAQVMDMISKRGIEFGMVEQVFNDLTSAGGMFYNMQEKQGNTLYGMWQKLGDAASLMYADIGNTEWINDSMKGMIETSMQLMRNWKAAGASLGLLTTGLSIFMLYTKAIKIGDKQKAMADAMVTQATERRKAAQERLNNALAEGNAKNIANARSSLDKAKADEQAALAAQKNAVAQKSVSLGFASIGKSLAQGLGIGLVITLVSTLIYKFVEAYENAHRLKNKLDEIKEETTVLQDQSVRNFQYLADTATSAPIGSKEQKEALEELQRTYSDMIPIEQLELDNLNKLKNEGYAPLTDAVREYIAMQQKRKAIDEINSEEGNIQADMQKKLRALMVDNKDLGSAALSNQEFGRFLAEFRKTAQEEGLTIKEQFIKAFEQAGLEGAEKMWNVVKSKKKGFWNLYFGDNTEEDWVKKMSAIGELSNSFARQESNIKDQQETFDGMTDSLGKFADAVEHADEVYNKASYFKQDASGNKQKLDPVDDSYLLSQMQTNNWIKSVANEIQNNTDIQAAFAMMGQTINAEWFNIIDTLNENNLSQISQINFDAILEQIDAFIATIDTKQNPNLYNTFLQLRNTVKNWQEQYRKMVPDDAVVRTWRGRWQSIAQSLKVSTNFMGQYLMKSGEDFEAYRKRIKSEVERIHAEIAVLQAALKLQLQGEITADSKLTAKEIEQKKQKLSELEQQEKALKELYAKLQQIETETSSGKTSGGRKGGSGTSEQDIRFEILKNEFSMVKQLYEEYKKMAEVTGGTKAASKLNEVYEETLSMLSKRHGISLPTDIEMTTKSLDLLISKMEELANAKNKKGKPLFPNAKKDLESIRKQAEDLRVEELRKAIEKKLKELSEEVSRSKTAKEFYDKILSQTGDVELATNVTLSIYGRTDEELFEDVVKQIQTVFASTDPNIKIDLSSAIDLTNKRINYGELSNIYNKYQDDIIEKNRDTAQRIISEGQKTSANNISTWEKELAKAKDFEQQRTDIIERETQRRADIIKSFDYTDEQKQERIEWSNNKEREDLANIDWQEFKESEDYIRIFEDLDKTSTKSLKHLYANLERLKKANKDLSPKGVKAIAKAMADIENEVNGRGIGNAMVSSTKNYFTAVKNLKAAKTELTKAQSEFEAQLPMLDAEIQQAKQKEITAEITLNALRASGVATQEQITAAEVNLNSAKSAVIKAEKKKEKAAKRVYKAEKKVDKAQDEQVKSSEEFFDEMQHIAQTADELASILGDVQELIGLSEDSAANIAFNSAIEGLQSFSKILTVIIGLQELYNIVTESNPWIAIAAAVLAVGQMLGSWISNEKVRKANKEIKRQQDLIDQLEYSLSRLEKAAEKAFGAEYIQNLRDQRIAIEAQAEAYRKQLEAEKSKGKKADKDSIKSYEESYRDALDALDDLQKTSEQFLGSTLEAQARSVAQAWLDAYKEIGYAGAKTTQAMQEQFQDMIENMVVESALAAVMKNALKPMFDLIDETDPSDLNSPEYWAKVAKEAQIGTEAANEGASILMDALANAGIKIKDIDSEAQGISRGVAAATSEEMTANTTALNTQNYYISQINSNVAQILARINGDTAAELPAIDYSALMQQSVDRLAMIERYSSEILNECRTIAARCEEQTNTISRVIKPRQASTSDFVVATKLM